MEASWLSRTSGGEEHLYLLTLPLPHRDTYTRRILLGELKNQVLSYVIFVLELDDVCGRTAVRIDAP